MIKVGYVPYSKNLQHPGDRRRLAAWALDEGTELSLVNPLDSDVLVLSNAANFNYWLKRAKQPVILDLVDGYLGERPRFIKDVARNVIRSFKGTSDLRWIKYTNHLKAACTRSDAVIVASIEQKDVVSEFNKNVHIILDDHSELEMCVNLEVQNVTDVTSRLAPHHLFWEGFGYTLKHFQLIAADLDKFLNASGWGMYLVTNEQFPKWGGYIGRVNTKSLIEQWFPLSNRSINIIPWSIRNVREYANKSSIGIIPVDLSDNFAALKSENKLLSMWHLGLPTLFSAIPSYSRVASDTKQEHACVQNGDWYASLDNFSQSLESREMLKKSSAIYIASCHKHKHLMAKWDTALNSMVQS